MSEATRLASLEVLAYMRVGHNLKEAAAYFKVSTGVIARRLSMFGIYLRAYPPDPKEYMSGGELWIRHFAVNLQTDFCPEGKTSLEELPLIT